LQVVDRDDDGTGLGESPQGTEHRSSAGERVVLGEQRAGVDVHVLEQVDEAGEAQRHLLLRRTRSQDVEAGARALRHRQAPHGRLPDPRLAADQQGTRALGHGVDEGSHPSPFEIAPYEARAASGRRSGNCTHRCGLRVGGAIWRTVLPSQIFPGSRPAIGRRAGFPYTS
jgi:hypothetical protein